MRLFVKSRCRLPRSLCGAPLNQPCRRHAGEAAEVNVAARPRGPAEPRRSSRLDRVWCAEYSDAADSPHSTADKPRSQSFSSTDIVASWQGSQSEMKWARGHAACRRDLDIAQMSSDKHPVHPRKLSGHQKLVRLALLCTPPPRPCTTWCQYGRL